MEETVQQEKFHHPKGLWLSCIGMCGSSFLKYAVSGFLIFFYTYSVGMGGLGLTKEQAGLLISVATTAGSILPLLGSVTRFRYYRPILGNSEGLTSRVLFTGCRLSVLLSFYTERTFGNSRYYLKHRCGSFSQ